VNSWIPSQEKNEDLFRTTKCNHTLVEAGRWQEKEGLVRNSFTTIGCYCIARKQEREVERGLLQNNCTTIDGYWKGKEQKWEGCIFLLQNTCATIGRGWKEEGQGMTCWERSRTVSQSLILTERVTSANSLLQLVVAKEEQEKEKGGTIRMKRVRKNRRMGPEQFFSH
jgi:hypothetical protein